MIIRGDENPYLRGKPASEHIPIFLTETESPFANVDEMQRQKIFEEFGKHHEQQFLNSLNRLREICRSYNFFQLLAHFGYYDQLSLDPERENPSYQPVEQNAVEILQALVLQVTEDEISASLDILPPPEILTEANKLLHAVTESFSFKRSGLALSTSEKGAYTISEMMRVTTAKLRNESLPSQVKRTLNDLASPLDEAFDKRRGVRLTKIVQMFWNVIKMLEERMTTEMRERSKFLQLESKKEIIDGFLKFVSASAETAQNFRRELGAAKMGKKKLRHYLYTQCDTTNFKLFWLSTEDWLSAYPEKADAAKIEEMIEFLSIPLGGLSSEHVDHFFLANPIWSKPIIKFGPKHWLLPIPAMFQSFGLRLLEAVIQLESDLWEKYQSKIRPRFLENLTAALLQKANPLAKVYRGVKWNSTTDGKTYETDILLLQDTQALIIECKAGHITDRGRRGDIMRLKNDIGKLIEEPTLQSHRFARLLEEDNSILELVDAEGKKFQVNRGELLRVARINVTMDYFGISGIQARMLREAGLVDKHLESVPTFHVHELENVIDILDHPTLLMHYLHRRSELETSRDLLAYERSLLAMYLATGFDLGSIEEREGMPFMIPTMDETLEPYFMGKELKRPVIKPKRHFTEWWKDILLKVQERKTPGWMESSYGLLSVGYERQQEFEEAIRKIVPEVEARWPDPDLKNAVVLVTGSIKRRVKVMCMVVKDLTSIEEQRDIANRTMNSADEAHPTPTTLAIVISPWTRAYPYSAIYLRKEEAED